MTEAAARDSKTRIQSVEKAFHVLDALKTAAEPARLTDIVRATGLKPNLARAYLLTLQRIGAVRQDPATARYELGEAALQLGLTALSRTNLSSVAPRFMEALAAQTGQSTWLSVWSERGPVVVAKADSTHASPFEIRVGSLVDLTVTATGRVFIAHLDAADWRALLAKERRRLGALAPSDKDLQSQLARVRKAGLAAASEVVGPQGVVLRGFASLAAPVFDHAHRIKAALTLIGTAGAFDTSADGRHANALRRTARDLSSALGAPSANEEPRRRT